MYKDVIKIEKRREDYLIFTSKGMLLSLEKREFIIFEKYGNEKRMDIKHKKFLSRLASYGVLEFENFKPKKIEKEYDLSLLNHDSSDPLYAAPVLAHLSVTNKCNMACRYCSVRKLHKMNQKELSTKEWKRIISYLAKWGVFQIGFTGGEPTLRGDLVELAKFVTESGCVFNLTTNGWILDENLISDLAKAGMKQCQVSLDSHIPKVHENLRGAESYERVINSIDLLKKYNISVGIDCVVSNNNIDYIYDFVSWLRKEKIPYLTLIKLKKGDLSKKEYEKLTPNYFEYSKIIKIICSRENNSNPNISLDCGSVSNLQQIARKESFQKIPIAGCPLGHHLICISPNGGVYACASLLDKKFCLGNILEQDIREIWKNNFLLKQFRLIKQKVNGKCKTCNRLDICRGGCRGVTYSISKRLFDYDPTCKFMEVKNEDNSG